MTRLTTPTVALGLGLALAVLSTPLRAQPATPEPRPLPDSGVPLEVRLGGGEAHRYQLAPRADGELWLSVDQRGVDVVVTVLGPEGDERLAVDNPQGPWGEEWLRLEAGAGTVVEIRALALHGAPGSYRLRVEVRPEGVHEDPRRRAAERAQTEAGRLYHRGTLEARRQAFASYHQALDGWRALGRPVEAARTLFLIGMLHHRLDELRQAMERLVEAAEAWQLLGDRRGEAQALMEVASTARRLGENEHVEEVYEESLQRWREAGDLQGQARVLNHLGLIRARTAPREALAPYEEALVLYRQIGDLRMEGVVLNNVGGVHDLLGEPGRAREHFRRALEIHRRLGDLRQQAAAWNNLASIQRRAGRFQEALEGYGTALEILHELGDRRGEGRALNNLGLTWLGLGDPLRARDVLGQALTLRRASEDRRGEAHTLHNLGLVHAELESWEEALASWTRVLEIHRASRDRLNQGVTLVALANALAQLGRPAIARRHLEDALILFEELGSPWRQAQAWNALGRVLTMAGEAATARTALERALELYRATGDEIGEGAARVYLARAERRGAQTGNGNLDAAFAHADAALDLLETIRADVDSFDFRATFLSRHEDAFELAIVLASELDRRSPAAGWAARGLEISERARARSLLDLLRESAATPRHGVDPALLERRQGLLERLNAKVARRRRLRDRPAPVSEELKREIRELLDRLEEVEHDLRGRSPVRTARAPSRPLTAGAVRDLLDPDVLLLEFFLAEERGFLWAVTAAGGVEGFQLPGREALESAARAVYEGFRIHDPRAASDDRAAALRLSEMLLGPVVERLTEQRLAIVADGILHYLPFAALPHPAAHGEPLLARHEIVTLPSASALAVQRRTLAPRPPAPKPLAVVADPIFSRADPRWSAAAGPGSAAPGAEDLRDEPWERLPWSRWEAERIAARAEAGEIFLDFDADLDLVRGGHLRDYRIVHFATHGIVDSEHPELSALVLSHYDRKGRPREALLRLPEIYDLDLDAELVVLSGCRTALGREIRGEGLVGLTRGFFAAGARRLVASLWRVQDRSAAELMDRFYRHLLDTGESRSPAAALRAAQLEMVRDPELADPYHWAAFALYGDWR